MLWPGPVGGVGRGCTERCGQKAQVGGREGEREAHLSARCSHIAQVRLVGRGGRNEGGQITQACVGGAGSLLLLRRQGPGVHPHPLTPHPATEPALWQQSGGGGAGEDGHIQRGRRHCWPSPTTL